MTQEPHRLRTEYAENPLGIDETSPDLRWRVDTDRRGARQTAFRVLVASTQERLAADEGDIWDTGKRMSDRPSIEYDGHRLASCETYHWKVRVWDEADEASGWSAPARWEMGPLESADWEASWIRRPEADEFERGRFTYLRREFDLAGGVKRARAYVSASHQYALSVNGEHIDRGQSFSYPDYQYYKTVDLGEHLTRENALGVLLTWNGEGQGRPAAEPGFLLQLVVEYEDGRERVVVTDESWRVHEGPWLAAPLRNGEIAEPVETVDGRLIPQRWDEPGFDDENWRFPAVVGPHPHAPWERLIAQVPEVVRSPIAPVSVERLTVNSDSDVCVFDFGRVYTGVPIVRFESGVEGRRVEMRAGYRRGADGTVSETEGTQWTDMHYAYIQRDGEQEFRPFNSLGFRYLQIDACEELAVEQVTLLASHTDVPDERAATFEADKRVTDVFELARHSALYGSQEQFIDTPTREKGQFLMDAFNISRTTTRAFEERTLTRQAIGEFVRSHYRYWATEGRLNAVYPNGDGKRDIPDFTVAFPEWVWQYYHTAGDRHVLQKVYPVIRAIADYVVRHIDPETGLVMALSGGVGGPYEEGIVDWPPEMRYDYDRDWPARTTVNALCVNALDRAATIAAELDRPVAERAYYTDHRATIETAINTHLTDGERYIDGCDGETESKHSSQHANALALAVGVVPEASIERVADRVVGGMEMGPMMVPWLLKALDRADRSAAMVDLLTDPSHDGWAAILRDGGTFTWETWKARDSELPDDERRNRSESHAMGATVLVAIQRTLLGVRFAAPAGAHIRIHPPTDGLTAASGRVPTERGPIDVSWRYEYRTFNLELTVPWNASATVILPTETTDNTVTDDGTTIWTNGAVDTLPVGITAARRTDDAVVLEVETGTYDLTVE